MQVGRVVGIGVSERHHHQLVALEVNEIPGQFVGNHRMIVNLAGETRIPKRREPLR